MKILEVATDVPPYKGGISRLVGLLVTGLKQRGHEVQMLSPRLRLRELKFSTIPFHTYKDYDVIHLHGPTPFLSDLTLLTNNKSPIVYTHHAEISWFSEKISRIYRSFHHLLAKKARFIIVHSNEYAHLFKGANVTVIRMPCTFEPPRNFNIKNKANSFTVLYVGQLRPFKGVDLLLKAASLLRDLKFIIIGDGYLRRRIIKIAKKMRNVKFVGAVSDEELKEFYKQSHVICLPSRNTTEAYGLVLIEGALYGCVPLASNLFGVRENLSNLSGLSFMPGSYIDLIRKIKLLAENEGFWMEMALRSQKAAVIYVKSFTPNYYIEKHLTIFSNVSRGA